MTIRDNGGHTALDVARIWNVSKSSSSRATPQSQEGKNKNITSHKYKDK
jgi:hypothetical protein